VNLQAVESRGDFSHFDTVTCSAVSEPSRTAIITGPEVEAPWQELVLYRWTVNGIDWVERAKERQVQFSQSCASDHGSAVWSGGQGSKFWEAPELTLRLELRLPGKAEALWTDGRVISLNCSNIEEGDDLNLSGERLAPILEDSAVGTTSQPSAGAASSGAAPPTSGCSMSEPTTGYPLWMLLSGGLALCLRRGLVSVARPSFGARHRSRSCRSRGGWRGRR
jgi:hypothetical protein